MGANIPERLLATAVTATLKSLKDDQRIPENIYIQGMVGFVVQSTLRQPSAVARRKPVALLLRKGHFEAALVLLGKRPLLLTPSEVRAVKAAVSGDDKMGFGSFVDALKLATKHDIGSSINPLLERALDQGLRDYNLWGYICVCLHSASAHRIKSELVLKWFLLLQSALLASPRTIGWSETADALFRLRKVLGKRVDDFTFQVATTQSVESNAFRHMAYAAAKARDEFCVGAFFDRLLRTSVEEALWFSETSGELRLKKLAAENYLATYGHTAELRKFLRKHRLKMSRKVGEQALQSLSRRNPSEAAESIDSLLKFMPTLKARTLSIVGDSSNVLVALLEKGTVLPAEVRAKLLESLVDSGDFESLMRLLRREDASGLAERIMAKCPSLVDLLSVCRRLNRRMPVARCRTLFEAELLKETPNVEAFAIGAANLGTDHDLDRAAELMERMQREGVWVNVTYLHQALYPSTKGDNDLCFFE